MRSPLLVLQSIRRARRARQKGLARCEYPPFRLVVETSSKCDLRCPMCPASFPSKFSRRLMKLGTFKKVIDEAASFVYEVDLSYRGEPLLNRDLPAMIAYADDNRVATHLSTNATHLTEKLALRLIQSGLTSITFSVDGLEPEAYDTIRVGASWDTVMTNITDFLKMKRTFRSRTPTTTVEVLNLPDAPVDEEKARRFLRQFRSLPPVRLVVRSPHGWAGSVSLNRADQPALPEPPASARCPVIWSTMVVLADGQVALCPRDWYNENPVGNLQESTLQEMWNGWTLMYVRELHAKGEHRQIELCRHCNLLCEDSSSSSFAGVGGEGSIRGRVLRSGDPASYPLAVRELIRRF